MEVFSRIVKLDKLTMDYGVRRIYEVSYFLYRTAVVKRSRLRLYRAMDCLYFPYVLQFKGFRSR